MGRAYRLWYDGCNRYVDSTKYGLQCDCKEPEKKKDGPAYPGYCYRALNWRFV